MRRACASLIVASAVALACATRLRAQDTRITARLEPALADSVERITDSARAAGVPAGPLIDKALEGASKHADPTRIIAAVRGLAARLGTARATLGAGASESDLVAAAGALYQGVPPAELAQLRTARAGQPLALPLVVLTDLIERGVPMPTATSIVLDVASRGAGDDAFTALRRNIEQDITAGAPPAIAAATRARGTIATLPGLLPPHAAGAAGTSGLNSGSKP